VPRYAAAVRQTFAQHPVHRVMGALSQQATELAPELRQAGATVTRVAAAAVDQ
jgi:hypothetical protein